MSHVPSNTTVAYFSMEIALDKAIPTYSGGLGVLAGDTLRSMADLAVPVVGITLLHRKGYFEQHLDEHGNQTGTTVWRGTFHILLRLADTAEKLEVNPLGLFIDELHWTRLSTIAADGRTNTP